MTSYLFPSSLAPLHVFVIAGQTPAPHVVIWGSDKCLQAVITSGRIHSVSIWKAARWRRCHSLSCQQCELKREEKKLKEKKKKKTDKGNFSLTSFPDGKAITRSRLYISARVREGMLQLQALLQSLERLGGEEDNLHDLGSPGFDHDLHKTTGIFKMARQMGSKPNCNTTQPSKAQLNHCCVSHWAAPEWPFPLSGWIMPSSAGAEPVKGEESGSSHSAFQPRTAKVAHFPGFGLCCSYLDDNTKWHRSCPKHVAS